MTGRPVDLSQHNYAYESRKRAGAAAARAARPVATFNLVYLATVVLTAWATRLSWPGA
ncbi:MAG: hypothetical protein R2708_04370 [Vicinamibacterales bacterium]